MNNAIGWLIGIVACTVYIMTAEATASWWDCGEYIATAFKLQVGHPPGAPTFQLFGRLFSLFTDPYHAAFAVNVMSAIVSGLGIMFLYWTITLLGKKMIMGKADNDGNALSLKNIDVWVVFASGIIGALAYTFTDTYWFSAVEGEVYAMSSFFTAVVFWAILKWEEQADDEHSMRWLVLICFLVGIAIGVHLLNLLTIPAIVYVVYFKKWPKTTTKGFIISGVVSLVILAVILWGIIPGIVNLSSDFDVFFVNKLHMGFNSGTIVYFLLIALFVVWGIWCTSSAKQPARIVNIIVLGVCGLMLVIAKAGAGTFSFGFVLVLLILAALAWYIMTGRNKMVSNTTMMGFLMVVVGYSTFFILVIRANTNTPLNENAPKDAVAMRAYLGREQYGQTPFMTGAYYTAGNPIGAENDYAKYIRTKDSEGRDYYKVASYAQTFKYNENHTGVFPRMWSPDNSRQHPQYYRYWAGEPEPGKKPSFSQNIRFFNRYQMGWMYWRYFMWNFAGRQNDIQGHHFDDNSGANNVHFATVNYTDGNWISGIKFVDEQRLGPQDNIPDYLKNNKARNRYFMLPLLLGMLGLVFHCLRNRKDAFVVFIMFVMTGIAIGVYLNMPPRQPRERDYAFVGSFYFFSIWIGLGVMALYQWLTTKMEGKERNIFAGVSAACVLLGLLLGGGWFILTMMGVVGLIVSFVRLPKLVALPLAFVLSLSVPVILAAENWDDHDRSEKYAARDFAQNYLGIMDRNSVLITFGDNDTFPLWYIQEVEGYRTDVRILNYTLSGMHWYVEQLYNKLYDSEALPFTFPKEMYGLGHEIFVPNPNGKRMEVTEALQTVLDNRDRFMALDRDVDSTIYLPTNKFKITLDKAKLVANGVITAAQADTIPDEIHFDVNPRRGYLMRQEMMMLDLIGTNRFERNISIMSTGYIKDVFTVVDNYSIDDGLVSLLVPYPVINRTGMPLYTERTADFFLKGVANADGSYEPLRWGNLNTGIYVDPISLNMGEVQRQTFSLLAMQRVGKGDTASARRLLAMCDEYFPRSEFPVQRYAINTVSAYCMVNDQVSAYDLWLDIFDYYRQQVAFYSQFPAKMTMDVYPREQEARFFLSQMLRYCHRYNKNVNPATGRPDATLTEEGEKAFVAASEANAKRLKEAYDYMDKQQ